MDNNNKKVIELNIDDVLPNRFQPRIKFSEESIIELSESIKEHGVIQPIVVRPVGDKYEIIAGERRYKASVMAGMKTIPALITDLNDKDSAEVALIENVQRKDLTPIEEAISYKKILDMGYLTQEQLAEKLGKSQSSVANKLRLLNLDEEVQEALLEDKISERHARSLLKLSNPNDQKRILKKIIEERLTVRKTDEEIDNMINGNYSFNNEVSEVPTFTNEPEQAPKKEVPFDFTAFTSQENNNSFVNYQSNNKTTSDIEIQNKVEEANKYTIPGFEDIFNSALSDNKKIEEENEVHSNKDTINKNDYSYIPRFEDMVANENNNIEKEEFKIENNKSNEEEQKDLFSYLNFNSQNNNDNIKIEDSKEEKEKEESPKPFLFDNLTFEEPEKNYVPNLEEESIEFINDNDQFLPQSHNESKKEELTTNNMYIANDMKAILNTVYNCADTIKKYGVKVDLQEFDFGNEYRVTFIIKK